MDPFLYNLCDKFLFTNKSTNNYCKFEREKRIAIKHLRCYREYMIYNQKYV